MGFYRLSVPFQYVLMDTEHVSFFCKHHFLDKTMGSVCAILITWMWIPIYSVVQIRKYLPENNIMRG